MDKYKQIVNELEEFLNSSIDLEFDFNREHWDNGNFDDSYEYGVDCGAEIGFRDVLNKLMDLKNSILNE